MHVGLSLFIFYIHLCELYVQFDVCTVLLYYLEHDKMKESKGNFFRSVRQKVFQNNPTNDYFGMTDLLKWYDLSRS